MIREKCFFLLAFVFVLTLPSCVNDPAEVNSITQKSKLPTISQHNVDLLYSDSAKLKVHVTAPQFDEYEGISPYEEMVKGVKVEFYGDSDKVDSYLTANYAIHKKREKIMEAKNDVVVVNSKGEKLNTEHLIWDENKRRIHTDAFVRITTADQVITGTGLDSDERFEEYEIKNITGTILLKDEPK